MKTYWISRPVSGETLIMWSSRWKSLRQETAGARLFSFETAEISYFFDPQEALSPFKNKNARTGRAFSFLESRVVLTGDESGNVRTPEPEPEFSSRRLLL